ncbi:3'-5' exonuclease [Endozoicomonas sp. SESOKO3]|uniref:3'-5' exonuclease n=1 Tax=Endozoicomonas sp. SESOKO3 TaxID=2828744 RepID=UPI002148CB50|nr:3'-5' exonuclease [Endozoicomonas sp. SESOKO3]
MDIFRSLINTQKVDVTARLGCFGNDEEEVRYIMEQALSAIDCGQSVAILLPTHKDVIRLVQCYCKQNQHPRWDRVNNQYGKPDYASMNHHMAKLQLHYVGNGYGDLSGHNAVVLMTYHSAKGLDFDNVYLPFLDQNTDIQNKSVFMVALTRSKNALTMSYSGRMHEYVQDVENLCHKIEVSESSSNNNNEWDFDF